MLYNITTYNEISYKVMEAIDLFAGAGGFTEGARMAGVKVKWAANHWRQAVEYHGQNHPKTAHSCQDLQQADWREVPGHDVMLASPACQGHSLARGKEKPHHDALRSTAWAVVACAEYHRSPVVVVENVCDFQRWILYPAWCDAMFRLGYAIAPHLIDAADHGVPQHRERLFLVCTKSQFPLQLNFPKRAHQSIANVIKWCEHKWSRIERPGHSIHRPIGTITTRDRWAVIDGDSMRMLHVSEVKQAMGFRADYVLPDCHKDALTMLGNAVCPPVSADILMAIQAAG